jgi:PPOX class probable F420-dependent enzyme
MDLSAVDRIGARDRYLAVVATTRTDGTVQASVVNAGVVTHPLSGQPAVAFVTHGPIKLSNLRARPRVTIVFRAGWEWVAVEGTSQIVGPDDPLDGFDPVRIPELLRAVFAAAGGTHDDWDAFDVAMADERRAAVLIHPERVYSNASR